MEGWAKPREAAKYAGISPRTLATWLKKGLTHSRLRTGTILIKYSDIDEYLKVFTCRQDEVEELVDRIMQDFNS